MNFVKILIINFVVFTVAQDWTVIQNKSNKDLGVRFVAYAKDSQGILLKSNVFTVKGGASLKFDFDTNANDIELELLWSQPLKPMSTTDTIKYLLEALKAQPAGSESEEVLQSTVDIRSNKPLISIGETVAYSSKDGIIGFLDPQLNKKIKILVKDQ
jgi:hypothetical protein